MVMVQMPKTMGQIFNEKISVNHFIENSLSAVKSML